MAKLLFRQTSEGFDAGFIDGIDERILVVHSSSAPFVSAGAGKGTFEMCRGNFRISERVETLVALREFEIVSRERDSVVVRFSGRDIPPLDAHFGIEGGLLVIGFFLPESGDSGERDGAYNRYRFILPAREGEHVYGCGEQFSYFDLKGRNFPLWTSEQGVGRNKLTEITRMADSADGSGGDYFWTFFPQTSFVSSARWWCHLDTSAYAEFDFRPETRHELYCWALPERLVIGTGETMCDVVSSLSAWFGRQGRLPDWCYEGVILGMQGGTETCLGKLAAARAAGVKVAAVWAQDWEGINMTSFGQRLRWNWLWDEERYPGLDKEILRLKSEGVRFLGYINPYVGADLSLYREAAKRDFLAKDPKGTDYRVEFGEFYAGIVDFTNPAAFEWYKSVIKKNLIGFGLSGWMADFGEYLPTDAVLHNAVSAELMHNEWPALWARCNREAIEEAETEGLVGKNELLFFMRAGSVGSQKYCPLMWAGDQNVDWSEDDGLPTVIPAALSLGLSGHGLHHSDIGGYTTLYGMKRSKELFMRWAEQSALTIFMRSHEGNRPGENWQFDSDPETLSHLAKMVGLHTALAPYLKALAEENASVGMPIIRPLFLHFEWDEAAWTIKDEYLLGADLLVAPILEEGAMIRRVHLPAGEWLHLWSGKTYRVLENMAGGDYEIEAPLGEPPLFARAGSPWSPLFKKAVACAR